MTVPRTNEQLNEINHELVRLAEDLAKTSSHVAGVTIHVPQPRQNSLVEARMYLHRSEGPFIRLTYLASGASDALVFERSEE